jgi:hypothetical protein
LEKRTPLDEDSELFLSGRIGCTAMTYQHSSLVTYDSHQNPIYPESLYPGANFMGQCEVGYRYEHFFISIYFDAMNWGKSPTVQGMYQPSSLMLEVGIKTGLSF